jgi:hypothetical protein
VSGFVGSGSKLTGEGGGFPELLSMNLVAFAWIRVAINCPFYQNAKEQPTARLAVVHVQPSEQNGCSVVWKESLATGLDWRADKILRSPPERSWRVGRKIIQQARLPAPTAARAFCSRFSRSSRVMTSFFVASRWLLASLPYLARPHSVAVRPPAESFFCCCHSWHWTTADGDMDG